jgi:predicted nucleic acid-binding protein
MKIAEALVGVSSLFLDTAPVIYYVESVSPLRDIMDVVVANVREGKIEFVTSPITLAECLAHPLRKGDNDLAERFRRAITRGTNTRFVGVDRVAEEAATLRAELNIPLLDAFQVACARAAGCDAFLTNDRTLTRVPGLRIIVLDTMES